MFAQNALDQHAQLRTHVLAQRPVDGDVAADGLDQFARNGAQRLVAEYLHRAIVGFQRVVERDLVVRQPERLAAGVRAAQVAGEFDQLFDHLRGFDGAVPVAAQGLLQHGAERARLDDVPPPARGDFALQQLLQQFDGQVALRYAPDLGQEVVGQDRHVGLVQAGRGENIGHARGRDRARDDLPHGAVQFRCRSGRARRAFRQHRAHRLEEPHVVADAQRVRVRHC